MFSGYDETDTHVVVVAAVVAVVVVVVAVNVARAEIVVGNSD